MQIGQLAELQRKKQSLQKQRNSLIRQEVKKLQKNKVNLDQSAVKKGYIEKHKIIAKKQYEQVVEKTKKGPVQVQDNASTNSYISRTTLFTKTLARTKKKVVLDNEQMKTSLAAVNAFAIANKQTVISFTLHFQQNIQCQARPCLIPIPHSQMGKVVMVVEEVKEKEGVYSFQALKGLDLTVMTSGQFIHKFNNEPIFGKKIAQQQIKCLVKFQIFKSKRFYQGLLSRGVPVFPIDAKKVPFCLQDSLNNYQDYILYMAKHYIAVVRSGQQQTFRLKATSTEELLSNASFIIHELTARLIERSKVKQNVLEKVTVKTASSINFELYEKPETAE